MRTAPAGRSAHAFSKSNADNLAEITNRRIIRTFAYMKVDCHCHILPGLDDGAQTLEESVFLASKLASWGYETAVCTSHSSFLYHNTPFTVTEACYRLQDELDARGIALKLVPSMEYRLIPERWPEVLAKDWILPWEGNHILL